MDYQAAFDAIVTSEPYQRNLDWGEPRPGHPEATIRAHIAELESNLAALRPKLSEPDYWKLRLLVHVHDLFKGEARDDAAIADPDSHASLARKFLSGYCADDDLLNMVQYHDESFALWRQHESKGKYNQQRFQALLERIQDWSLFLAFHIIDGCTAGKSREPLHWLFREVASKVESQFSANDIL